MKLSTKGRYGTRALVEMARHYGEGPLPLKDIAGRQQISLQYLERLMAPLLAAHLVRSIRGAKGGRLWAVSAANGTKLSELALDAPPVFDGMAAGGGRIFLSTQDGKLLCFQALTDQ